MHRKHVPSGIFTPRRWALSGDAGRYLAQCLSRGPFPSSLNRPLCEYVFSTDAVVVSLVRGSRSSHFHVGPDSQIRAFISGPVSQSKGIAIRASTESPLV